MHRSAPLFLNSIALLGMAALAGCESTGTAQTAPTPAAARSVTAAKLERKRFELTTVQPAVIQAFEETPLYAKIAGYVEEVAVDIGDRVQKGQVLVRLSVPELRETLGQKSALVAQAEAEIAQAAAAIRAAEASRASAQASVHHADAGVVRARADYDRWHSEFTRLEQLAANGSVTSKLVDEARHQFQSAEAAQAEAAAALEAAKAGGLEKEANIAQARADADTAQAKLRVAEAERDQARTMLAYTELRAPFDGIITRREIDPGHYVQPTVSTPLLVVTHADVVRSLRRRPRDGGSARRSGRRSKRRHRGAWGQPDPRKGHAHELEPGRGESLAADRSRFAQHRRPFAARYVRGCLPSPQRA